MADLIEGYKIIVVRTGPGLHEQAGHFGLHLNQIGGAHVTNPDNLIMQIEDAVFKNEQRRQKPTKKDSMMLLQY